jgi:hypothetical protein
VVTAAYKQFEPTGERNRNNGIVSLPSALIGADRHTIFVLRDRSNGNFLNDHRLQLIRHSRCNFMHGLLNKECLRTILVAFEHFEIVSRAQMEQEI